MCNESKSVESKFNQHRKVQPLITALRFQKQHWQTEFSNTEDEQKNWVCLQNSEDTIIVTEREQSLSQRTKDQTNTINKKKREETIRLRFPKMNQIQKHKLVPPKLGLNSKEMNFSFIIKYY